MKKLLLLITLLFSISFIFTVDVDAKTSKFETQETSDDTNPLIIDEMITVTDEGGKFEVGFANIRFKHDFLAYEEITFRVQIYAENGNVYIEFTPDVEEFDRPVHIQTSGYEGYIYDVATGESIYVEIPAQSFKVEHFSRYCWAL